MIPKRILDAVQDVTHFGPGGRDGVHMPPDEIMSSLTAIRS